MNRLIRAIIAIFFVAVITFSGISICQNVGKSLRLDITDHGLYTLSDGTKTILGGLNQPVRLKLYYTRIAALKGPDQIRFFNNYYHFVIALLDEYVKAGKGKVELEVIDPRPFSDEEVAAIRYGLKRFSITEEENFFFGLVVQTQFGVEKTIEFFSPDRQSFVEYDISYLIDTATTRQKKKIGVISSIAVMGDDVTGYMAQMMRMQGQTPKAAWTIVQHLKQIYEVSDVGTEVEEISDVDILLVIHPKDLGEQTLFAIDQFVLKGGRTIVFVDPYCIVDQPDPQQMMMGQMSSNNSNLAGLMNTWGLRMPENTFAGDRALAMIGSTGATSRPEKILSMLNLNKQCFNAESVITSELNQVRVMLPGVLERTDPGDGDSKITYTPLVTTTNRGNSWTISGPYELRRPDYARILSRFVDGSEPVVMAYQLTGRFKSSFPEGIEVADPDSGGDDQADGEGVAAVKTVTGLTESSTDGAVIVFADVDMISDSAAYQRTFFGTMAVSGDNSSLLLNAIEDMSGSSALISIRSRGNFSRPFTVVDEIELQAEQETAVEAAKINAAIAGFQQELTEKLSSLKADESALIQSTILIEKREIEAKIAGAQRDLRLIKSKRRKEIEALGSTLRNFCTLPGPGMILLVAIAIGIRRKVIRRHYISHASDS